MSKPATNKKKKKNLGGRPPKVTQDLVNKLEQAFAIDANVSEACAYAGISRETYYKHIRKNKELADRFEQLKLSLPLKARKNIATAIDKGDIQLSERFIKNKYPVENAEAFRIIDNHTPEEPQDQIGIPKEDQDIVQEFRNKLKLNMINRSREKAKEDGEL